MELLYSEFVHNSVQPSGISQCLFGIHASLVVMSRAVNLMRRPQPSWWSRIQIDESVMVRVKYHRDRQ